MSGFKILLVGEKGVSEKRRAPPAWVFNPKTSDALEGDNRKSIRAIKSVRKPLACARERLLA